MPGTQPPWFCLKHLSLRYLAVDWDGALLQHIYVRNWSLVGGKPCSDVGVLRRVVLKLVQTLV
jgi:hypothetical protein